MKICVFGAGAIGGHLAARLAKAGVEVSVVARGAHLAAMQAHGLTLHAPDLEGVFPVRASDDPAALGPQDAVLVTVKAPALPSVAAAIGPLLGPETAVVFVMNGIPWWYFYDHGGVHDGRRLPTVDPGDAVWNAVGPERAIGGVVYSACTVVAPGVIHVETVKSRLVLGEPANRVSARAAKIAAPLEEAGFQMVVTDRIRDAVWSKLMLNLTSGPLGVLTQSGPMAVYAEPACAEAVRRIVAEGAAIAEAMGCAPTYNAERQIAAGLKLAHKPSIVQDLELGRPMEIAAMLEAPLELARMAGVATPTLDFGVALARLRAKAAGLY